MRQRSKSGELLLSAKNRNLFSSSSNTTADVKVRKSKSSEDLFSCMGQLSLMEYDMKMFSENRRLKSQIRTLKNENMSIYARSEAKECGERLEKEKLRSKLFDKKLKIKGLKYKVKYLSYRVEKSEKGNRMNKFKELLNNRTLRKQHKTKLLRKMVKGSRVM